MNVSPIVNLERIDESNFQLPFQFTKCLNELQPRESITDYLDELAAYISASASDMCSLSVNPDKCAILQETVNQIRQIKLEECGSCDELQKSEVSSSKPNYVNSDVVGPLLLHALNGFLFMVNTDGKIEYVTANVKSFLKYSQENLIDKSIYNIIHVGDHARFSSNLLPMSIGNGFGWSEPNASVRKNSFNCRFLIKPPEDQEETMEEKQTRVSQYENMQISALLVPYGREKNENNDIDSDIQNHLVCVARRIPQSEKSNFTVEQFQTRLDFRGKIISVDTSCVSASYSQYINKDLAGRRIQDICYHEDFPKLNQHLKETLQQGSNTSGIYRLRLAHEKILYVQSKSKRYSPMASDQEIIISNHSIIRDSDHCLENNVVNPQRSNPSLSSGNIVPSLASNMNGNSYSFSALSPQEFNLNDIGLDFLPSSSWDLGSGEEQNMGDGGGNHPIGGPSPPASSSSINSVAAQRTQNTSGSAFSPELRSPAQVSATNSPAPGRATPFSNTFPFSPVSSQTVSRTNSPAPQQIKREESSVTNNELSSLSPMGDLMGDTHSTSNTNNVNQKLRNLLTHGTHGIEEADSSVPKTSSEKMEDMSTDGENDFVTHNNSDVSSRNENIILRELLNQEDEDISDENRNSLPCDSNCNINISNDMCSNDSLQKRTVNNNNMLRKLLNNDDDKSFKKNQDILIQQLLKTEGKVSVDASLSTNSKPGVSSGLPNSALEVMNSVVKRKSPDTPTEESIAKRQVPQNHQHAHLAGQNPMLASMLAQTPKTAPSVPTSIANAIVSQLPQERLPKNLEKKLVHTPYTGAPTSGTSSASNSQYSFSQVQVGTRSLLSTSLQQEVVTADSRGHVTLAPHTNAPSFPQVNFVSKMLPTGETAQSMNLPIVNYGNNFNSNSQQHQSLHSANNLLFENLTELSSDLNAGHAADPLLSDILDQVWSMEQDMNLDSTSSDDTIFKLLEDIPDPTPVASPRPASTHDVNEKMAINAIQRQLMSFEIPGASPRNSPRFQQQASMPMIVQQNQMASNSYQQVNQFQAAPPAYTVSNPIQRTRAPGMHPVQNNMAPTSQQLVQLNTQRQAGPQYTSVNDLTPQMRRQILERRQLYMAQVQQKRLLLQKQQLALNTRTAVNENMPNIQSPASSPFTENINDLMNNTVAPNVTLQRSASMPEPQLSPRYASVQQQMAAPPQSPQQLSPGQQRQPPSFSPQQQGYPAGSGGYPPSRLSPHMQPQAGGPTQTWVQQRSAQNPASLQQQNPMLNAQLSQARFSAQQQQQTRQIVVRSMPSPGSRNSPYSNPPDSPFHPPSPGVTLYQQQAPQLPQQQQQANQQRLQRAVSIPNRVNSPRGLPAGFGGNDPLLSPQPSPGNYNPPVSSFNSMPVSTSSSYNSDNFSYEQQVYPVAVVDRNRNSGGNAMTSEYVRQELRAMVGARTQQHQVHQQQLVQQMPQAGSQSTNQSLSQADFDALGFSLDLDGQPSSPALFPQSLLSVAGGSENQSRTSSPRFQLEEQRPAEQKKSLLQQLLSEPP
ncbi:nuclear receptor coactivator 3-like [Uloborus diversus]|uniref:nuclear receptor coactivator 3-like n=1 Tax=Uloborus diversus TaxID=327109 RepID=UPI00240A1C8E|nr:nuclear receptor coactivator 3-like [Uloborus diversus]